MTAGSPEKRRRTAQRACLAAAAVMGIQFVIDGVTTVSESILKAAKT